MDLNERIAQEYEREERAGHKPTVRTDIPFDFDAVTDEWLTDVLCPSGVHVVSHALDEPDDGTSNRRRIFVQYDADAVLPPAVFCKATQGLRNRQVTAGLRFTEGEHRFYNSYRDRLDIESPRCIQANHDPVTANSILVFHDLALEGGAACHHDTEITRERAQSQLDLLATLHGSTRDDVSQLPRFEDIFESMERTFDFEQCAMGGFADAEQVVPRGLWKRSAEVWPATLRAASLHDRQARTYLHVDCHIRNWYTKPGDVMGVCDYQTFSQGHWAFDVTYALTTSLSVEHRRAWLDDLLAYYLDRRGLSGVTVDDVLTAYRQHLFTALAWWTATLTVAFTQPRESILTIIERIATAIDDLGALA